MTSRNATSYGVCVDCSHLNALRRKLTSERGASLSMALLFVVICVVVGFVIVTAATGLAGRATKVGGEATREELDQKQYVLRSAAQLVRDQIEGQYVCAASVKYSNSGTETKAHYVASGTSSVWSSVEPSVVLAQEAVAAGGTPTIPDSLKPDTALEYLAAEALGYTYTGSGFTPENYWTIHTQTINDKEKVTGYSLPYSSDTGDDTAYFEMTIGTVSADQSVKDIVQSVGNPRCRIESDAALNLTVLVYYSNDRSDAIQMYLPATITDYPEEVSKTIPEGTTTEYTSTTDRIMVTW